MKLLQQITQFENECVLAAIACASGYGYEEVRVVYPEFDGIRITLTNEIKILEKLNIPFIRYVDHALFYNRVYIVTVPSLNTVGGTHRIVIDTRNANSDWSGNILVYDSQKNVEGKLWYDSFKDVKSWFEVIEIVW